MQRARVLSRLVLTTALPLLGCSVQSQPDASPVRVELAKVVVGCSPDPSGGNTVAVVASVRLSLDAHAARSSVLVPRSWVLRAKATGTTVVAGEFHDHGNLSITVLSGTEQSASLSELATVAVCPPSFVDGEPMAISLTFEDLTMATAQTVTADVVGAR